MTGGSQADNAVSALTRVASLSDVPDFEMLAVNIEGIKLALFNLGGGEIRATANICTHEFAILTDGWFEGCEIECPLHSGRYDVRTGKALCEPPKRDLATFDVEIRNGDIFVALPERAR